MIRGCFHKLHVVVPLRSGNADSCEYHRIPSNTHRIPFSRAPEYPLNTPTVTMPTYLKICILGVLGRIYSSMLHVISTFQLVCCYGFFRAGLGTRRANEGDCCRMKLLHVSIEGVMRARSGTGCATVWKEFTGIHGHVLRHSHQEVASFYVYSEFRAREIERASWLRMRIGGQVGAPAACPLGLWRRSGHCTESLSLETLS